MSIAIADVDIEVTIVVEITSRYRRCERHDLAWAWTLPLNFEQDMEEWITLKWYTIGWDREETAENKSKSSVPQSTKTEGP